MDARKIAPSEGYQVLVRLRDGREGFVTRVSGDQVSMEIDNRYDTVVSLSDVVATLGAERRD